MGKRIHVLIYTASLVLSDQGCLERREEGGKYRQHINVRYFLFRVMCVCLPVSCVCCPGGPLVAPRGSSCQLSGTSPGPGLWPMTGSLGPPPPPAYGTHTVIHTSDSRWQTLDTPWWHTHRHLHLTCNGHINYIANVQIPLKGILKVENTHPYCLPIYAHTCPYTLY